MKEVPVVVADDLTEDQIKAYRLVDNKLNESDWDEDILQEELEETEKTIYMFFEKQETQIILPPEEENIKKQQSF